MTKANKSVEDMVRAMKVSGEHSPLFWWFVTNHDQFRDGAAQQRVPWAAIAAEVAAIGLTNRRGAAPSPKLTKLTWQRARSFVAKKRASDRPPHQVAPEFPIPIRPDVQPRVAVVLNQAPEVVQPPPYIGELQPARANQAPVPVAQAELVPATLLSATPTTPRSSLMAMPPRSQPAEQQWTPEQQARIDQELSKAFGLLDYSDRFHKL